MTKHYCFHANQYYDLSNGEQCCLHCLITFSKQPVMNEDNSWRSYPKENLIIPIAPKLGFLLLPACLSHFYTFLLTLSHFYSFFSSYFPCCLYFYALFICTFVLPLSFILALSLHFYFLFICLVFIPPHSLHFYSFFLFFSLFPFYFSPFIFFFTSLVTFYSHQLIHKWTTHSHQYSFVYQVQLGSLLNNYLDTFYSKK